MQRDGGETVGYYRINRGSLGNTNYTIGFNPGTLTITGSISPALDNTIQSVQQTLSAPTGTTTAILGSNLTNLNPSLSAQSGGLEVVEVGSGSPQAIVDNQSAQSTGPLQLFVIDGGISLVEDS